MSTDVDSEYIEEVYESFVTALINNGFIALAAYEYLITFDQEVALVWRRKISLMSVLLLVLRWGMLAIVILENVSVQTDKGCQGVNRLNNIIIWLGYGGTALFSALRVSAIWGRNRLLFVLILLLGTMPIWTNLYTAVHSYYGYTGDTMWGCYQEVDYSDYGITVLHLLTRISLIVMDALVVVLTWVKTFTQWRECRKLNMSHSIAGALIRDGTIYFLFLLGINLAQILTYNLTFAPVNLVIAVLPNILVGRFIINLREVTSDTSKETSDLDTKGFSNLTAPRFNISPDIVGSMGEPIAFGETSYSFDYDTDESYELREGCTPVASRRSRAEENGHLKDVPRPYCICRRVHV